MNQDAQTPKPQGSPTPTSLPSQIPTLIHASGRHPSSTLPQTTPASLKEELSATPKTGRKPCLTTSVGHPLHTHFHGQTATLRTHTHAISLGFGLDRRLVSIYLFQSDSHRSPSLPTPMLSFFSQTATGTSPALHSHGSTPYARHPGHSRKLAAAHHYSSTRSLCFRHKQVHTMKQCFAATCETSRCHTTRSFHDLRCQLFRISGATLLSRHWTSSFWPQEPRASTSTACMHISHHVCTSHRIPPTTHRSHPPMTNFTLSPSKYRKGREGRRVVIDPMPQAPQHPQQVCPRLRPVRSPDKGSCGSSLNKLTNIQAVQAKLPTRFTFPRMHKLPIAHTQSIMYSYIHPRRCNTSHKVDTGPHTRQDGNATVGNPRNEATAPRQQSMVLRLVPLGSASRLVSSFPRSSSPSHLHIHTRGQVDAQNRDQDAHETPKGQGPPTPTLTRSQRTTHNMGTTHRQDTFTHNTPKVPMVKERSHTYEPLSLMHSRPKANKLSQTHPSSLLLASEIAS
ncbi:hypothetical protein CF327_g3692 [Tilletia walkeri]|nr:hypothetical protein CF327_g3692 [Tilletia walkeri]